MKKFFCFLLFTRFIFANPIQNIDEITYQWLSDPKNIYSDHISNFKKLFEKQKINTFLEFGLGYSTKYFLDNCNQVFSVEIINQRITANWYYQCKELYENYNNWFPYLYQPDLSKNISNNIINEIMVEDLGSICDSILLKQNIDVAFVDPGIFNRYLIVNMLFKKNIPIIVAHDTNNANYLWKYVKNNRDYEKIIFKNGRGTTFWIKKDLNELINFLKN